VPLCMRWRLPVLAGVVCSLAAVPLGGAMSEPAAAAPPVLLALPGPLFPKVDFRPSGAGTCSEVLAHGGQFHGGERFLINGAPLFLEENPHVSSDSHVVLTAVSVWDCSLMLAKFVEHHADNFRGKTVLELGSGQGVVGIAAAMCGADLVVLTGQPVIPALACSQCALQCGLHASRLMPCTRTDVSPALPSISHNIELNNVSSRARAMEVDWLQADKHVKALPPADIILAADVVWVEELVLPFVDTLSRSLQAAKAVKGPQVFCLLCHKTRSRHTDDILLKGLEREGLSVEVVPAADLHPTWHSSELVLWRIRF